MDCQQYSMFMLQKNLLEKNVLQSQQWYSDALRDQRKITRKGNQSGESTECHINSRHLSLSVESTFKCCITQEQISIIGKLPHILEILNTHTNWCQNYLEV